MRVKVTLACGECKQRNYNTIKNKKNDPDRIEMCFLCAGILGYRFRIPGITKSSFKY